jgi:curved DNA-binding protein CbpA
MSALPDYYRVLHVQPDAPAAIIHASYRTLVQRALNTNRDSHEVSLLDAAYAILGDPQRRAVYDFERLAETGVHEAEPAEPSAAGTRNCLFCGAAHGLKRTLERDDQCGRCASPLFPAERHRFEYSGQRMLHRIPKQHGIEVFVTWPQDAPIRADMRNLSLNGMSFVGGVRFHLNQVIRIDCSELRALARVAHLENDPDGSGLFSVGVEFLTLRFRQVRGSFVSAEA